MVRPLALASALLLLAPPAFSQGADASVERAAHAYRIEEPDKAVRVKRGKLGDAVLRVVPLPEAHIDPRSPFSVTLTASEGLGLPKARLTRPSPSSPLAKSAEIREEGKGAVVHLPFEAKAAGKGELHARLSFFICVADLCLQQKRDVAVPVVVE